MSDSQEMSINLQEQALVKHVIVTMINAIDTKQWGTATAMFTENVFVDYSSLSGQPGGEVKAADLVGGWEELLKKVSTHHMLTNFDISVSGDQAEVWSHVYASHAADGLEYWDAYGRYYHKLTKITSEWKITGMTLLMHGQKGNKDFLKQVRELSE